MDHSTDGTAASTDISEGKCYYLKNKSNDNYCRKDFDDNGKIICDVSDSDERDRAFFMFNKQDCLNDSNGNENCWSFNTRFSGKYSTVDTSNNNEILSNQNSVGSEQKFRIYKGDNTNEIKIYSDTNNQYCNYDSTNNEIRCNKTTNSETNNFEVEEVECIYDQVKSTQDLLDAVDSQKTILMHQSNKNRGISYESGDGSIYATDGDDLEDSDVMILSSANDNDKTKFYIEKQNVTYSYWSDRGGGTSVIDCRAYNTNDDTIFTIDKYSGDNTECVNPITQTQDGNCNNRWTIKGNSGNWCSPNSNKSDKIGCNNGSGEKNATYGFYISDGPADFNFSLGVTQTTSNTTTTSEPSNLSNADSIWDSNIGGADPLKKLIKHILYSLAQSENYTGTVSYTNTNYKKPIWLLTKTEGLVYGVITQEQFQEMYNLTDIFDLGDYDFYKGEETDYILKNDTTAKDIIDWISNNYDTINNLGTSTTGKWTNALYAHYIYYNLNNTSNGSLEFLKSDYDQSYSETTDRIEEWDFIGYYIDSDTNRNIVDWVWYHQKQSTYSSFSEWVSGFDSENIDGDGVNNGPFPGDGTATVSSDISEDTCYYIKYDSKYCRKDFDNSNILLCDDTTTDERERAYFKFSKQTCDNGDDCWAFHTRFSDKYCSLDSNIKCSETDPSINTAKFRIYKGDSDNVIRLYKDSTNKYCTIDESNGKISCSDDTYSSGLSNFQVEETSTDCPTDENSNKIISKEDLKDVVDENKNVHMKYAYFLISSGWLDQRDNRAPTFLKEQDTSNNYRLT